MFYRILIFIALFILFPVTACDENKGGESKVASTPSPVMSFMGGETVKISQSGLNPIDHALSLVGLNRSELARPLYHEEGYHMMCRIPLTDRVSKSPFYLHNLGKTFSDIYPNQLLGHFYPPIELTNFTKGKRTLRAIPPTTTPINIIKDGSRRAKNLLIAAGTSLS